MLLPRRNGQDAVMHGGVGIGVAFLLVVAPAVCNVVSVGIELPVSEFIIPFGAVERIAVEFITPERRLRICEQHPLE